MLPILCRIFSSRKLFKTELITRSSGLLASPGNCAWEDLPPLDRPPVLPLPVPPVVSRTTLAIPPAVCRLTLLDGLSGSSYCAVLALVTDLTLESALLLGLLSSSYGSLLKSGSVAAPSNSSASLVVRPPKRLLRRLLLASSVTSSCVKGLLRAGFAWCKNSVSFVLQNQQNTIGYNTSQRSELAVGGYPITKRT